MTVRFATLSKYPPYVSGHALQAYWNNLALADALGVPSHQLSYSGCVPPEFVDDRIAVHQIDVPTGYNERVADGHLVESMAAGFLRAAGQGANVFFALYANPHAQAALRAQRTLQRMGQQPIVMTSLEGSDITWSLSAATDIHRELALTDIVSSDVVMTASQRAKSLLLNVAESHLSARALDHLAERIVVRYPGLPKSAFESVSSEAKDDLRQDLNLRPSTPVVSYYGRLSIEKGILLLPEIAKLQPDVEFVVAGEGPDRQALDAVGREVPNLHLLGSVNRDQAHVLRAASDLGIFPSQTTAYWEETFCIAALEYQALGIPVVTSDLPAFGESTVGQRVRAEANPVTWANEIAQTLRRDHHGLRELALDHARQFTNDRSANTMIQAATAAQALV